MSRKLLHAFAPSLRIRTLIALWAGSVFLAWAVPVVAWMVARGELGGFSRRMQAIFQPFGRGRAADALADGTGIGLYVVKQIVEAHEGQIEVHSEPGHGATFLVKLPLTEASREARELHALGSREQSGS